MNILIIRLSSIGDIFHTLTLVNDIRFNYPQAKIDWLVDSSFKDLLRLCPDINNIIDIPLRKWKENKFSWFFKLVKFKKSLNNIKYDYIIDTQGLIKTAFLSKFLFNGKIYGLGYNSAREFGASYFYNYKFTVNQDAIAVIRLRKLGQAIFNYQLNLNTTKINLNYITSDLNLKHYIFLLHGTSKPNKQWSQEKYLILIKYLLANSSYNIVLTFSNFLEEQFARNIVNKINDLRVILLAKMQYNQLCGVIKAAKLVIGVDTGFTHLANLFGITTLAIYLNSNPSYVGIIKQNKSHIFGGIKSQIEASEVIKYIEQNKLLGDNCV